MSSHGPSGTLFDVKGNNNICISLITLHFYPCSCSFPIKTSLFAISFKTWSKLKVNSLTLFWVEVYWASFLKFIRVRLFNSFFHAAKSADISLSKSTDLSYSYQLGQTRSNRKIDQRFRFRFLHWSLIYHRLLGNTLRINFKALKIRINKR